MGRVKQTLGIMIHGRLAATAAAAAQVGLGRAPTPGLWPQTHWARTAEALQQAARVASLQAQGLEQPWVMTWQTAVALALVLGQPQRLRQGLEMTWQTRAALALVLVLGRLQRPHQGLETMWQTAEALAVVLVLGRPQRAHQGLKMT